MEEFLGLAELWLATWEVRRAETLRLTNEARKSLAERDDKDLARFMVLAGPARGLAQKSSAFVEPRGGLAAESADTRCDEICLVAAESLAATELANFEATDEEVFLLCASAAVAAVRRRASVVRPKLPCLVVALDVVPEL